MRSRVIIAIALFAAALALPWWCAAALGGVCVFVFPRYFEVLAIGWFFDAAYAVPAPHLAGFPFVFLASASLLLALSFLLRKRLRLYAFPSFFS